MFELNFRLSIDTLGKSKVIIIFKDLRIWP